MEFQNINIRRISDPSGLPGFAMGNKIVSTRCAGNRIALCRTRPFCGVKIFEKNGTMIRDIPLPYDVVFAAVRRNRIYGFSPYRDCVLLDLEGNTIPLPWKDWPKEKEYHDMSPDGSLLLYRETLYPSGTLEGLGEYRVKNLDTGVETILEKGMWEQEPKFLNNETILQRVIHGYGGLVCFDARTGKRTGSFLDRLCDGYTVDQDNGRVYAALHDFSRGDEVYWTVYNLNGELIYESREQGRWIYGCIALPLRNLAAYILVKDKGRQKEYELCVHDSRQGRTVYREIVSQGTGIYASPDGQELYIMQA